MGRKPSTIVAQYFQRGAKLSDSSNRYEHTCRYCAAQVSADGPSLCSKRLHYCMNPETSRQFPKGRVEAMKTHLIEDCSMISDVDRQRALDQVGDSYGRKKTFRLRGGQAQTGLDQGPSQASDTDLSALQTLAEVSRQQMDAPSRVEEQTAEPRPSKIGKKAKNDNAFTVSGAESAGAPGHSGTRSRRSPQQVVIDPRLNGNNPAHHLRRSFLPGEPYKASTLKTVPTPTPDDDSEPGRPAPNGFLIDFRLEPAWGATNVRSRFSPSRKKEVGEIRKKGACVRCRMLKKPCSDGDPCDTCKVKGSRRLWKQQCIRTRLADEVDVFDTRMFFEIADAKVKRQAVAPTATESMRHTIEMSHFDGEHAPSATVETTTYQCTPLRGITEGAVECIDTATSETKESIQSYIQQSMSIALPYSTAVDRSSLQQAASMNALKPDDLLVRSISLWKATHLLIVKSGWHVPEPHPSDRDFHIPNSIHIISAQLDLSLSQYAHSTAHALASSLEKRLLQRHAASSSQFETLVTSVILLLCIAKIAYYHHIWIRSGREVPARGNNGQQSQDERERWPLAETPDYAAKAERVAGIIIMLLRVRGIAPTTHIDKSGIIQTKSTEPPLLEVQEPVQTWLNELALKAADMKTAMDMATLDGCEYDVWEKRVLGGLLLPDGE